MKRGLVLGGGGLVGMGYHTGVFKALDEWGIDLAGSDVMVGTSAGSVMAAYLASGWTIDDFYEYGHGRHPEAQKRPEEQDPKSALFDPIATSHQERARRAIGSAFAVVASRGLWRSGLKGRKPHNLLRKAFPAGLFSTEKTLARFREELPQEWPRPYLYICAADLYTGQRVAFGHPTAPEVPFPEAVLSSTAIPGFFPPVKLDGRQYVDGGIVSATSLDLAADAGCDTILCVAPLGYRIDPDARPRILTSPILVRNFFARQLAAEVRAARERGVEVLVIRPWTSELGKHGSNSMRHFDRAAVIESAREGTLRLLEENPDHPAVVAATRKRTRRTG
jgi:NTE family protein